VAGEMAALQGPNRTLNVTRGDVVPGVGKVVDILRWGQLVDRCNRRESDFDAMTNSRRKRPPAPPDTEADAVHPNFGGVLAADGRADPP
jgi:hypothetical protein